MAGTGIVVAMSEPHLCGTIPVGKPKRLPRCPASWCEVLIVKRNTSIVEILGHTKSSSLDLSLLLIGC